MVIYDQDIYSIVWFIYGGGFHGVKCRIRQSWSTVEEDGNSLSDTAIEAKAPRNLFVECLQSRIFETLVLAKAEDSEATKACVKQCERTRLQMMIKIIKAVAKDNDVEFIEGCI